MDTELTEVKKIVLNRYPPGDRWVINAPAEGTQSMVVFPSLTDALDGYYQKTGETLFTIDAKAGTVSVTTVIESEKKITKYSLYGEE